MFESLRSRQTFVNDNMDSRPAHFSIEPGLAIRKNDSLVFSYSLHAAMEPWRLKVTSWEFFGKNPFFPN